MTTLTVFPAELTEMPVGQLARLPATQLHEIDANLTDLLVWAKTARAKLDAALEQRYGEQSRIALRDSGRDFGTSHIQDGALAIKFEQPKRVKWDQKLLAEMATRIAASGEPVESYLDIKLSVSESRYTNWPPALQQQFAAARTVEAGKPSFHLTVTSED